MTKDAIHPRCKQRGILADFVKQEDRSAAGDYLKKASDNYEQMLAAVQKDNYNAAATLAVQCIISSADALCVFEKGIRSVSQKKGAVPFFYEE